MLINLVQMWVSVNKNSLKEQLFVQQWDMMMPSLTAVYNVRVVRSVVLGSTASLVGFCLPELFEVHICHSLDFFNQLNITAIVLQ